MRRRRLLVLVAIATAVVAASIAAAHLDQEFARAAAAQSPANASSPIRTRDALTPATMSNHDVVGITQLRGLRADWRGRAVRNGVAVLAAALVLLALRSRRAFTWSNPPSSLWRGAVPLGRGPPTFLAI